MIKNGIVALAIVIAGLTGAHAAIGYSSENWGDRFATPTGPSYCSSCGGIWETSDTFSLSSAGTITGVDLAVLDWYGGQHESIEVSIWDDSLSTNLFSQTFTFGNYSSVNLGNSVDLLSFDLSGPTLSAGSYRMSWFDPLDMAIATYTSGSGVWQSNPTVENTTHNVDRGVGASFQIYTNPAVNPIPEPETYAMMLAGLGLMGLVARRRKQKIKV